MTAMLLGVLGGATEADERSWTEQFGWMGNTAGRVPSQRQIRGRVGKEGTAGWSVTLHSPSCG